MISHLKNNCSNRNHYFLISLRDIGKPAALTKVSIFLLPLIKTKQTPLVIYDFFKKNIKKIVVKLHWRSYFILFQYTESSIVSRGIN